MGDPETAKGTIVFFIQTSELGHKGWLYNFNNWMNKTRYCNLKYISFGFMLSGCINNSNWTLDTVYPVLDLLSFIRTEKLLLHTCTE